MADKDDKSLIGFDPLAWMEKDAEAEEEGAEQIAENETKEVEWVEGDLEEGREALENESEGPVEQVEKPVVIEQTPETDWVDESTGDDVLLLEPVLTIRSGDSLFQQLAKRLDSNAKIEIDASAVTAVDTAILQLLVVVKQACVRANKELVIDFPSEKFIESAKLLGIAEILAVEHTAAGFF